MKTNTFKKAVSYFALASVFTMAGCKKDDVLENSSPNSNAGANAAETQTVRPIEGQYIVVLNDNASVSEVLSEGSITPSSINSKFEGAVKGFSGKLTKQQIETLGNNRKVKSIEQDQEITLIQPQGKGGGGGKPSKDPSGGTTTTDPGTGGTTTDPGTGGTTTDPGTGGTTTDPGTGGTTTGGTTTTVDPAGTTSTSTQQINWGVARVGYGDGTGKTAWVIDSGVNPNHPDLNVDVSRSRSFLLNYPTINDGYGHGTAVAGVIGAKDNNIGIVGVAANATIVALRVFDDYGRGSTSDAIKAVNYVIANAQPGDVVNMSLGGGISATLDAAVQTAAAKGIFFAIAAGNSAVDCINNSPARANAPNVYTVSSMNQYAQLSWFSNYGQSVDISAPGEGIVTTDKDGTYGSASGTSIAAPHVAGLLLLRGNAIGKKGYITGDKDAWPDPIASK